MKDGHELRFTRADDWGPVSATCSECGPLRGSWQTTTAAETAHNTRRGENAQSQSHAREVAFQIGASG